MQNNLILHAGANAADLSQVAAVATPEATETWQPIAHIDVVNLVERELRARNLEIVQQAFGLWRDGQRFFGTMEIRNGNNAPDYSLVVGIRNSHDKSFPAGAVLGSRVFVCDNLAFSGEVRFSRKHTLNIVRDLPGLVNVAMGKLIDARAGQAKRIEAYKGFEITDAIAHDIMVRAVGLNILPATKLPQVLQEWRKPSHDDFLPRTGWSLFNAFTETYKGNLAALPRRTQVLHGMLDNTVGLATIEQTLEDEGIIDAEFEIIQ